jgi:hypothetical protein
MNDRHLYTIRWTQPYATEKLRPYLRDLQQRLEQAIDQYLEESNNYPDAKVVIDRIKKL